MIVAGIGCRRGVGAPAVLAAVAAALDHFRVTRLDALHLDALAAPDFKRPETGLLVAARRLGLDLRLVSGEALKAVEHLTLSRSAASLAVAGVASASEAAALAACGAGARLLGPRLIVGDVTCAIASDESMADGEPGLESPEQEPAKESAMTVHFIGAGPGAADLITLRGRDLLARCPVCLYAGSIVPRELLQHCPPGARLVDTAPLSLDDIEGEFVAAHRAGQDVARLHSGDLSIWSAAGEQMRRLDRLGIAYTLTPGVPAFAAAAAALGAELTLPGVAQSLVLTRLSGRASAMPPGETLATFGASGTTLAIHFGIQGLGRVVAELTPLYGPACPVAVVVRASWPDERIIAGSLADIEAKVAGEAIERTALILVGPALGARDFRDSALYDAAYQRRFRGREGT